MPKTGESALEARGLVKRYGDVVALNGLDLTVHSGECLGLLGPNGAGKTTSIEIFEGLLFPDEGTVTVLGLDWRKNEAELRERLGIQLQESQFAEKVTVAETLQLFRSFYRNGLTVDEMLRLVQLEEKRNARVGKLSGGQKQRLSVACALIGDPDLLFLDEPTTGLDPQSRRQLWDLVDHLRERGRTILLTTHYMDEAERLCDHVVVVDRGRAIASGTPRQLIRSLGAEQVVECSLNDGSTVPAERFAGLPGVLSSRLDVSVHRLQVNAAHETIPALLALVAEHGATLSELRTHSPTLEDVFVSLTGRHLRESE